ncbi:MAG: hypothetical protein GY702_08635 [Desulfobulbaceae bacterium]|nr:hypothetical protein [Desulfobulbaceae bacterium]
MSAPNPNETIYKPEDTDDSLGLKDAKFKDIVPVKRKETASSPDKSAEQEPKMSQMNSG